MKTIDKKGGFILDERRKILSDNLKYYLDRRNLSPSEFCRVKAIPYTTFLGWYNGKNYPNSDKLQLLADCLGVNKSDLTSKIGGDSDEYSFNREDYSIAQDICENPKLKKLFQILSKQNELLLDSLLVILNPSKK